MTKQEYSDLWRKWRDLNLERYQYATLANCDEFDLWAMDVRIGEVHKQLLEYEQERP